MTHFLDYEDHIVVRSEKQWNILKREAGKYFTEEENTSI